MPSTITEVSAFTAPVTVPADGDVRNAASVDGAFQALANRTLYLRNALMTGAVFGTGAWSDGATLNVGEFMALVADQALDVFATTIPLAGLTPNAWYYAYVGTGGLTLSLVAPDAALRLKSDDPTKVYLFAVYAKSATTVRPFRFSFGARTTVWRRSALAEAAVLSGAAGAFTDVDCTAYMPPHARVFLGDMHLSTSVAASTSPIGEYRTKGDTAAAGYGYAPQAAGATSKRFEVEVNSARAFQLRVTNGTGGTTSWLVEHVGFAE
jgi:hypothetical protein